MSDLIGAHRRSVRNLIDDVQAGLPSSEAGARLLERGRAIHAELAAPHGQAGEAAWQESLDRFADGWAIVCEHFGLQAA